MEHSRRDGKGGEKGNARETDNSKGGKFSQKQEGKVIIFTWTILGQDGKWLCFISNLKLSLRWGEKTQKNPKEC